jgi:hypothetical protein
MFRWDQSRQHGTLPSGDPFLEIPGDRGYGNALSGMNFAAPHAYSKSHQLKFKDFRSMVNNMGADGVCSVWQMPFIMALASIAG